MKQVGPRSPLGSDCLWAFCVGGGICLLGEVLRGWYLGMGLDAELAGTLTSCTLIVLSALLTTLGLYQKLAARAGAGSLVPITGFANAVVSAAIEFKPEGRVCGTGAKMFTIAGPADRSVYNTPAGVQKLQFPGKADGAEYRTSAIIAQIPKKNSPERGIFSWRPAGVTP